MADGLLEVTLQGFAAGQVLINRWNYTYTGSPVTGNAAFALNEALGFHPIAGVPPSGSLLDKIKAVLHTSTTFVQAICIDPYDPTDFDASPFVPVVVGEDGGGSLNSPVLALGFRSNQTRRDIRRGMKRFGGVSEAIVGAAGVIDAGYSSDLNDIATVMAATLTGGGEGGPVTFIPCIVSKERYDVPGTDPVRHAYRYYTPYDSTGLATQLEHIATGMTWEPYADIRSQVSRQYGRGV